jgi:hypothetical protein
MARYTPTVISEGARWSGETSRHIWAADRPEDEENLSRGRYTANLDEKAMCLPSLRIR